MADSIKGVSELTNAFKLLSTDLQKKTGRQMVAAAANVVRKQAKTNAQSQGLVKSGALVKNIAIKRDKNAPANTIQYNVGVRHGRELGNGKKVIKYLARSKSGRVITKRKDDPFYWRFLEFGTKDIKPKRFITNAFEGKKDEALNAMQIALNKALEKAKK